jgi:hypothetical protein
MVISSGDIVIIGETDRFVNSSSQVATQLVDSVSGEIKDFDSMVNAIKKAYSSDPSLVSLIQEGGITKRGWTAIFEHPKIQNIIRRNNVNSDEPSVVKRYVSEDKKRDRDIERVISKQDLVVGKYTGSGVVPAKDSKNWTKLEERYLSSNLDKKPIAVIYRDYNRIFKEKKGLSEIVSKSQELQRKRQK